MFQSTNFNTTKRFHLENSYRLWIIDKTACKKNDEDVQFKKNIFIHWNSNGFLLKMYQFHSLVFLFMANNGFLWLEVDLCCISLLKNNFWWCENFFRQTIWIFLAFVNRIISTKDGRKCLLELSIFVGSMCLWVF